MAFLLWAAISVFALAFALPARTGIPSYPARSTKPPIVLLVLDELPLASLMTLRGEIDHRLFPNFARLANDSTWFRNATAVAAFTKDAIPSLLTGLHRPRPSSDSLFTIAGKEYEIVTDERIGRFCPKEACHIRRSDGRPPGVGASARFGTSVRGQNFASFLDLIERASNPRLHYLHLVMPHSPWRYLPTGQVYRQIEPLPGENDPSGPGRGWGKNAWLVTQAYQRHLLQVRLADRLLGALLDRLRAVGIYDATLLGVVADHGMAFKPGAPKRLATQKTVGEIAPIPMFLKLPGQRAPTVTDAPVELIDLVPTIADFLDASSTDRLDGKSVLVPDTAEGERQLNGAEIKVDGSQKFIAVARKYRRFENMEESVDLFGVAPRALKVMLDQPLSAFEKGPPIRGSSAIVSDEELITNSSSDASLLPALLRARLEGFSSRASAKVAVALDKKVLAVTKTFRQDGGLRFYCMLPRRAFRKPPHELDLFAVTSEHRLRRLHVREAVELELDYPR